MLSTSTLSEGGGSHAMRGEVCSGVVVVVVVVCGVCGVIIVAFARGGVAVAEQTNQPTSWKSWFSRGSRTSALWRRRVSRLLIA